MAESEQAEAAVAAMRFPKTKQCADCGGEYQRTARFFYRQRSRPDGLTGYCKRCHTARLAARQSERRRSDPEFRERRKARQRRRKLARYATDVRYREQRKRYSRAYYHRKHPGARRMNRRYESEMAVAARALLRCVKRSVAGGWIVPARRADPVRELAGAVDRYEADRGIKRKGGELWRRRERV